MDGVARGTLRIHLGAAPGVGKTHAVLDEAHRRASRGTDVVIGLVETHGRRHTADQLTGLEVLPRRAVTHRGVTRTELDVDAVLARHPEVVVVDELAHTNAPGSRNPHRWQDVDEILDAGIHVLSTVDLQHPESLDDVVEQITGTAQQETVPDAVVRRAGQVELVDTTAEALRRRPAHVDPAERVDAAPADRVDEEPRRYAAEHDTDLVWETRERVVVALTGGPEGETLVRRASRVAQRSGGDLLAVHVLASDGLTGASPGALRTLRELVDSLGGSYHQVVGDDVAAALLEFARSVDATQLVIGTSRRSRWARAVRRGIGGQVVADSGEIDVHVVTHAAAGSRGWRLPPLTGALTARRRWTGLLLAVVGVPVLTTLCLLTGASLPVVLLAFLLLVLAVALTGGLWPALVAAVLGGLAENWFVVPPTRQFTVHRMDDVVALLSGLVVATAVATVVDRSARRATVAARSRAETAMLASLARSVLAGDRALPSLLEQIREAFGLRSVTMVERTRDGEGAVGTCGRPDAGGEAVETVGITDTLALRLAGRPLPAEERRLLVAFAEQAAVALHQRRLTAQAAEADRLAAGNSMRSALLAAVSHDLRTPLAGIKAAVSALRAADLDLDDADRAELTATIEESTDRLVDLVENLLDMSRLQAGVVSPVLSPSDLPAVAQRALRTLDATDRARVRLDWPDDLPLVRADPGLLERVAANLVGNAVRHASAGPVTVAAAALGARVELRVVDRGPGVALADRDRVFAPFQRLGDAPAGQGVGLGLAVARGLTEAMGGSLTAEDTPGGGLTMVASLRAAAVPVPATPLPAP
ncbi:osmosensitive K+ channel signal transduction histidine kinase [Geodermatophilus tzadiensis]|uniref:histidine kinase n=1 Tax=Geodermatophilus tzadiensis TaxID=1137988 RepID=A0A2T0TTH8_9ACTN|nr:ATP-binding protein [Geodermatophilus tzadiensis]PRY49012.1 osmosensitive K+ channel signal transduction histidine kinase [Geodermatophilus tzadiensis]